MSLLRWFFSLRFYRLYICRINMQSCRIADTFSFFHFVYSNLFAENCFLINLWRLECEVVFCWRRRKRTRREGNHFEIWIQNWLEMISSWFWYVQPELRSPSRLCLIMQIVYTLDNSTTLLCHIDIPPNHLIRQQHDSLAIDLW